MRGIDRQHSEVAVRSENFHPHGACESSLTVVDDDERRIRLRHSSSNVSGIGAVADLEEIFNAISEVRDAHDLRHIGIYCVARVQAAEVVVSESDESEKIFSDLESPLMSSGAVRRYFLKWNSDSRSCSETERE